ELDRSRASEDADQHPEFSFVGPDFFDNTVEVDEWAVDDLHALADREEHARLRLDRAFLHLLRDSPDFFLAHRRRIRRAADEARNLRRFLDDMPPVVVQLHLDEDVAGKKFSRRGFLFPLHELHDLFDRHEDLAEFFGLPHAPDALFQRRLHFLLVAGESVDDVPLLSHKGVHEKLADYGLNGSRQAEIDDSKKEPQDQHHDDNDHGGRIGFLLRRPMNFFELLPRLLEEFDGGHGAVLELTNPFVHESAER